MASITCTRNLYKVLHLEKTANETAIKQAYRTLALQHHPDKQPTTATEEEKNKATELFQEIGLAYSILSDTKKRTHYDQTGAINTDTLNDSDMAWTDYFKELWQGVVTTETLLAQEKKYRESEEERQDILTLYQRSKGNLDTLLLHLEYSTAEDCHRIEKIIRHAISSEEVPFYKALDTTTTPAAYKRRDKAAKKDRDTFEREHTNPTDPTDPTEQTKNSLATVLQKCRQDRERGMDQWIKAMEAKASRQQKTSVRGSKQTPSHSEPSEEEFERIQQSLLKNKKQKTKG
ncbi:DnaJ domain-containing protein [Spinellus fusiger]|nr:DnaJ domain-containing protein [Spinellus fusiger]